jgi:glycosyltransferase involved in cell wall biosynthesis
MQLVIITPYPPAITGIGQYGFHVTRHLARSNVFSSIIVLTGKSHETASEAESINVEPLWQPGHWNIGQVIPARLNSIRPDLVWFNLGMSVFGPAPLANLSGFSSVIRAKQLGFPTLVTLHEMPEFSDLRLLRAPGGQFARIGAHLLTGIAAQADVTCLTIQNNVSRLSSQRPGRKIIHIPVGAYNHPELLPESRAPELLFFSTLAPFKGIEVLIEAFRELRTHYPRIKLTIAGASHVRFPRYADQLKHIYHQIDGIHWIGQVAEKDIKAMFSRAQIVILPYQASTGASSVLTQAASWGRPVVASNLPEIRSSAHENGFNPAFFQSGDVNSLVETIKEQVESPLRRWSQVCQNFNAVQRIRPEEISKAYLRAFNMTLETHRSAKRIPLPVIPGEPA